MLKSVWAGCQTAECVRSGCHPEQASFAQREPAMSERSESNGDLGEPREVEVYCGRERSGSPQPKSRAKSRDLATQQSRVWLASLSNPQRCPRHWRAIPARPLRKTYF